MMRSIWFSEELPANSALPKGEGQRGGALMTEGEGQRGGALYNPNVHSTTITPGERHKHMTVDQDEKM